MAFGRRSGWILAAMALALLCYYLPWFVHQSAGFTTNAYDLAEWSSLHPATRSSNPPLLTSFLLRLPHVLLLFAAGIAANGLRDERLRWIVRAVALLLVLRLVPPVEFFRDESADPNYRQMLLLTVMGGGLVLVSLVVRPGRAAQGLIAASLMGGVGAGLWGLSRAGELLYNFEIDVQIGAGAYGLAMFAALAAGVALWPDRSARRTSISPIRALPDRA
ncbi:hypothetical protein [Aggregatilinea lenta]|uniref:hypothetical protein n=1 Tax=Aggregatilinea lenta TaxID=913108 RepID=UPI0013C2E5A5|nr:hypothetical protein [Aggregatilinea lenta]